MSDLKKLLSDVRQRAEAATEGYMKIEIEVSEQNESTSAPWWVLIDPASIRSMLEGVAEHGEIPDDDRIITAIAFALEGPYFSRKEATDYLNSRKYAYSDAAKIWCHSGYRARQYRQAIQKANDIAKGEGK